MRDILFRGKMPAGAWIEGNLLTCGVDYDAAIRVPVTPGVPGAVIAVDPATVGQFTGFTDKNGKKIYEGDIVTLSYMGDKLYSVIWLEDEARFLITDGETDEDFVDFYVFETEIVGNIHDNPELLEAKK